MDGISLGEIGSYKSYLAEIVGWYWEEGQGVER